jgi:hypothetical protein
VRRKRLDVALWVLSFSFPDFGLRGTMNRSFQMKTIRSTGSGGSAAHSVTRRERIL